MRRLFSLLPLLTACSAIQPLEVELDDSVDQLVPGAYRATFELSIVRSFADVTTSTVTCEDNFTLYVDPEGWPEVSGLAHCDIEGDSRALSLSGSFPSLPGAEGELVGGGLTEYWTGGMTGPESLEGSFQGIDVDGQSETEIIGWFSGTFMDASLDRREDRRD